MMANPSIMILNRLILRLIFFGTGTIIFLYPSGSRPGYLNGYLIVAEELAIGQVRQYKVPSGSV